MSDNEAPDPTLGLKPRKPCQALNCKRLAARGEKYCFAHRVYALNRIRRAGFIPYPSGDSKAPSRDANAQERKGDTKGEFD